MPVDVPSNVTVLEPGVKVGEPETVQLPVTVNVPEGAVRVPDDSVTSPLTSVVPEPVNVPPETVRPPSKVNVPLLAVSVPLLTVKRPVYVFVAVEVEYVAPWTVVVPVTAIVWPLFVTVPAVNV